jgi:hypothetical protein
MHHSGNNSAKASLGGAEERLAGERARERRLTKC